MSTKKTPAKKAPAKKAPAKKAPAKKAPAVADELVAPTRRDQVAASGRCWRPRVGKGGTFASDQPADLEGGE